MHEEEQPTQPASVSTDASVMISEERARFRRGVKRVSILVVLIVVGAHLLVGVGAGIWVVARYFDKPKPVFTSKPVEMKPEPPKHVLPTQETAAQKPQASMSKQIQSLKPSALTLPALPNVPVDVAVPMDPTAPTSVGEGVAMGTGTGAGTGDGFFGGAGKPGSGLLEGTLYDLKQTKDRQDSKMDLDKYAQEVSRVADRGPAGILGKYYAAPVKLYLPNLSIPQISADDAPKEFKVEKEVQPKMWLAVYEGKVIAPESGRFIFDGFCDDILLVWINKRLVLDGSLHVASPIGGPRGQRKTPEVTMQKGVSYNIQIAIGEMPGGVFYAWLQLKNVKTNKPFWFRVTSDPIKWDSSKPLQNPLANPPSADNGPVFLPASVSKSASSLSGVGGGM